MESVKISKEKIRELGRHEIANINPKNKDTDKLKARLTEYEFNSVYPDDSYIWLHGYPGIKGYEF